jgi:translation initiation factor 5A
VVSGLWLSANWLQVNVDDGFLNLMNSDGASKDDVKVPEGDLGKQIQADFEDGKDLLVTIVSAMGEEQVVHFEHFTRNQV